MAINLNNWMRKRTGILDMAPESQSIATRFMWIQLSRIGTGSLTATFWVLFLLDELSFQEVGLLISIMMLVRMAFDYPTGALGDWIGHKYVFLTAYILYCLALLILLFASSFEEFVLYGVIAGIAGSQESGSLESWLDNNYRQTTVKTKFDEDRKIYGAFMGKMQIFYAIINASMFVVSGFIAAAFLRRSLFFVQFWLLLGVLVLSSFLMTNLKGDAQQKSLSSYGDQLIGGLRFASSSWGLIFFFLGSCIIWAVINCWGSLMLFPYYESYAGSDEYVGILRSAIYLGAVGWQILAVKISKKIKTPHKGIFWCALASPGFFALAFLYYTWFPPGGDGLVLTKYLGLIIAFQLYGFWPALEGILRGRLMVDLIPDNYRNSVYSLIPTITVLLNIPLMILAGYILSTNGFTAGFYFVISGTLFGVLILGLGLYWLQKPQKSVMAPLESEDQPSSAIQGASSAGSAP
ncbi:MAG: MFS transporter [Candidatus Heimdallarchaeota archaeon]